MDSFFSSDLFKRGDAAGLDGGAGRMLSLFFSVKKWTK